jgi:hypothetical protein
MKLTMNFNQLVKTLQQNTNETSSDEEVTNVDFEEVK